jgi:hypothetical protein
VILAGAGSYNKSINDKRKQNPASLRRVATTGRARCGAMALIVGLPVQARFFFLLIPRLLAGRCTPYRLASYAIDLTAKGSGRLGTWCWDRAVRGSAHDEPMCEALFELCVRAGRSDAAAALATRFYDTSGLSAAAAVRHTGSLVLSGAYDAALKLYDRLLEHCGEDIADQSPAPLWDTFFGGRELRGLVAARVARSVEEPSSTGDPELSFARLCFSFSAFDTSAQLFERAALQKPLHLKEQIAQEYALLRSDRAEKVSADIAACVSPNAAVSVDPDWRILLASVLFTRGAAGAAAAAVEQSLRARFPGRPDLEQMISDCRQMVTCIAKCPATMEFSGTATEGASRDEPGIRKIFVCGNGWSGSSALYDALMEYDGLAEMPDAPGDRYLNDCTSNEMMFVQGPAGLGRIWRTAKQERKLSRLDLWELFRCHVSGAGAIGYVEHKSATAASHLMALAGSRYTSIFLRTFEGIAEMASGASVAGLRAILTATTESLTAALASEGACVVFNNAVFGPNLDMLEIFRNVKAAVVTRDPLDTYADRRAQDVKHWMSPGSFVSFYRGSRKAFHIRKDELPPEQSVAVREIEFEQFVLDESYRNDVLHWLLGGQSVRRVRSRFEPERSMKNVGIHKRLLEEDERNVIERDLKKWRRS